MSALIDMAGAKIGRLTAVRPDGQGDNRRTIWLCVCDCGNEKRVAGSDLRRGRTRSCGCINRDRVIPKPVNPGRALPCVVEGCGSRTSPEGDYCAVHRRRITRHGDPHRAMTVAERVERSREGIRRMVMEAVR